MKKKLNWYSKQLLKQLWCEWGMTTAHLHYTERKPFICLPLFSTERWTARRLNSRTDNKVWTEHLTGKIFRPSKILPEPSLVFERRTSTGSAPFSFLGSGFGQIFGQIVSTRIRTLNNTNLVASRLFIREKASLPLDLRRSKTPLVKFPFLKSPKLEEMIMVQMTLLVIYQIQKGLTRKLFTNKKILSFSSWLFLVRNVS